MDTAERVNGFLRETGMSPETRDRDTLREGFLSAMRAGLRGEASSIPMLPAYLDPDIMPPEGEGLVAIDAGGTNFRAAFVRFGKAGPRVESLRLLPMPGAAEPASWEAFARFAAREIAETEGFSGRAGICFSYPAVITPERDGRVCSMTKQVRLAGAEGKYVCASIAGELSRLGSPGAKLVMLNDTVAAALGSGCDIGLIWGTGLNTCCAMEKRAITKLGGGSAGRMLVNMETGSYTGLPRGEADMQLDADTVDPGLYLHEKSAGGAYFGPLAHKTLILAARAGLLSDGMAYDIMSTDTLDTAECFAFLRARGGGLFELCRSREDETALRRVITALADRAAMSVAACLSATLRLTGADGPARIAAEGGSFWGSGTLKPALTRELGLFEPGRSFELVRSENVNLVGAAKAALTEGS